MTFEPECSNFEFFSLASLERPAETFNFRVMAEKEEEEEEGLYCLCRRPYQESEFMIECDVCKDWFHGRYV